MTAAEFVHCVETADYTRVLVNAPGKDWLPVEKKQAFLWRDKIAETVPVEFETDEAGRWLWIG